MTLILPTELEGVDALTPALCKDTSNLKMTLDMKTPSGLWEEKWSEGETVDCINCWSPAWIDVQDGYKTFNVQVDEHSFIAELQTERQDIKVAYDIDFRIAFKN
jgi:hypothetical protein